MENMTQINLEKDLFTLTGTIDFLLGKARKTKYRQFVQDLKARKVTLIRMLRVEPGVYRTQIFGIKQQLEEIQNKWLEEGDKEK